LCPNGHTVNIGDLLCGECGVEIPPPAPPPGDEIIPGWVVIDNFRGAGAASSQFKARRLVDGKTALVTIYCEGVQPNAAVYETLRHRLPRDHVPELIEYGTHERRAYDVTELVDGGTLADTPLSPIDLDGIRSIVKELGSALNVISEVGLRHRALHPAKVLVRSRTPLDLVITGFESARLSEADLETASLLDVTRYSAPEAVMGAVAAASDWWGLGMILLGLITADECFECASAQVFLINVLANGAPIPDRLEPRVSDLLHGLLANDRTKRWQWSQVKEWLDGGSPRPPSRGPEKPSDGPAIQLGGKDVRDPRRFAIEAARANNWQEACELLSRGRIVQWAEELKLPAKVISNLRPLARRIEIPVGFRLGIAIQLLNPHMPLIYEEEIVTPNWLLAHHELGYQLITGPIPNMLESHGIESDGWLSQLCRRAKSVDDMANNLEIELDQDRLRVLVLSEHGPLATQWELRRGDYPDASQPGVASLLERRHHASEDLIVLLAANLDQFRSTEEIYAASEELGAKHGLPRPSIELARKWLAAPRRELYAMLDDRVSGFARCSQSALDGWADRFRLERRLALPEVLLLLAYPAESWQKPKNQEYVASVLGFFEKRISVGTQRGQLVKMRVGKTTPRLDLTELAENTRSATTLLTNLIQRSEKVYPLSSKVFEDPEGPARRARTLLSRSTQYSRDTGINGTYIGFPFLSRRAASTQAKPLLAPVLLWPAKLSGEIGTRGRFSLAFDTERGGVRLNPAFEVLFGLDGARAWRDINDDLMSRSTTTLTDIIDAFAGQAEQTGLALRPLPLPDELNSSANDVLICSAVLFHLEFVGQSLLEDLRQIKQRPLDGSALEAMLRFGKDADRTDERNDRAAAELESPRSSEHFAITDIDPSQEEVLAKANNAPGLLVHGPPGTGKSQTIVNLVANSIGHRKTVLIVCQKLPALEVVRKRLVAGNLGDRIVMITNVTSDRRPLLNEIRDQLDNLEADDDLERTRSRVLEAAKLKSRIDNLESEIDKRHESIYRIDPTSGYSYRRILGELIQLEEACQWTLSDVIGLRMLLGEQTASTVTELEDICASLADAWAAARYEDNPLEATKAIPHDDAYLAEFTRVLEGFTTAEEEREAIPKPLKIETTEDCPEGLDDWLGENRVYISSLTDVRLKECAPLIRLFSKSRHGEEYIRILERLTELESVENADIVIPEGFQEWVGRFEEAHVAEIATACERHAAEWLASSFEGNPLEVVQISPSDSSSINLLQVLLENFEAAEAARERLLAAGKVAVSLSDPAPLENWLHTSAAPLERAVVVAGECLPPLLRLEDEAGLCGRYETSLRAWLAEQSSDLLAEPIISRLEALIVPCDEQRAGRIANECTRAAIAWIREHTDPWMLERIAHFPSDDTELDRLTRAIKRYVDEVKRRDLLSVNLPSLTDMGDPDALRRWLDDGERTLTEADPTTYQDVAGWHRLFYRSAASEVAIAQEVHKRLETLHASMASHGAATDDQAFVNAAANVPTDRLPSFSKLASRLAGPDTVGFVLGRIKSRFLLWWWLRSNKLPTGPRSLIQAEFSFRRELERRRIRTEIEDAVRVLGISVEQSSWEGLEAQTRGIIQRLTKAYVVCKIITKCPGKIDKSALLKGGNRDAVVRYVRDTHAFLNARAAEQSVQDAFESLKPFMYEDWLESRAKPMNSRSIEADQHDHLDTLLEKLPGLKASAALHWQLAGCDPLTPKVLACFEQIRSQLELEPIEQLPARIHSLVRRHAISARKRRLEESSPILRGLSTTRLEDARSVCEKLSAIIAIKPLVDACPEPSSLRTALETGSQNAVREALDSFRAGVSMSRARRDSALALAELGQFMDEGWRWKCAEGIESGASNGSWIRPLLAALPGISAYMAFRKLATLLQPNVVNAFALLAKERKRIEMIPEEARSTSIAQSILVAYNRHRKILLEAEKPALRGLLAHEPESYSAAVDTLRVAKKISRILRECPLTARLAPSVLAGDARDIERIVQDFERAVARARSIRRSVDALSSLRDWMKDDWIRKAEKKIRAGGSNAKVLRSLRDAMPTHKAFQLFRTRVAHLSPLHFQIFRSLASVRPSLEGTDALSGASIAETVRRTIRREALLAWKTRIETMCPELLVTEQVIAVKVASLARLDEELRTLNRQRLGADLPVADIQPPDQWEDITRLMGKRAIRLREFFAKGRERGLLTLRPVWLMTPEVVSQLLPLEKCLFDSIILDEASQMPVEFAVPSLYRATVAVVSGDDKQMPPSSFFSSRIESDETEWSDDDIPDDSASERERFLQEQSRNRRELKDCPDVLTLGLAVLPKATLQIHYRSEYRELIGYSNAAFYRNELGVTVRHPDDVVRKHKPIEYVAVNGTYDSQQNADEARKVVAVLAELWRKKGGKRPSIGILTFNMKQAELIEELLQEHADADAKFRDAFARELDRKDNGEDMSLFIKNVENVQGDERDVIIFSTTFGRNKAGQFRRNFGALGQAGGERRLNVAVTRARSKVIVIGSMPIEEISDMITSRRQPQVPRDYLQVYLQYSKLVSEGRLEEARRLSERLSSSQKRTAPTVPTDEAFKSSVAEFVRALGHDPISTRDDPVLAVDFSIADPDTGRFGVGIECDPPMHRLTRKARAREIWRRNMLLRAYPVIHRVSVSGWYNQPSEERARLESCITKAIHRKSGAKE
jgi:hypothetical protein